MHSNTFLLKSDPQMLLKLTHKRYLKLVLLKILIHNCYSKLVSTNVTQIDPQTLLKITLNKSTSVTQINSRNYLKHYSKLVLKALLKLKNVTCKDCTIEVLNKTKLCKENASKFF